jgi:hypothetical protein
MPFATHWDIWNAGLIDGPEPPGRRCEAEVAMLRSQADGTLAEACFAARQRWNSMYGTEEERRRAAARRSRGHILSPQW